jgi:hypothetical protein
MTSLCFHSVVGIELMPSTSESQSEILTDGLELQSEILTVSLRITRISGMKHHCLFTGGRGLQSTTVVFVTDHSHFTVEENDSTPLCVGCIGLQCWHRITGE